MPAAPPPHPSRLSRVRFPSFLVLFFPVSPPLRRSSFLNFFIPSSAVSSSLRACSSSFWSRRRGLAVPTVRRITLPRDTPRSAFLFASALAFVLSVSGLFFARGPRRPRSVDLCYSSPRRAHNGRIGDLIIVMATATYPPLPLSPLPLSPVCVWYARKKSTRRSAPTDRCFACSQDRWKSGGDGPDAHLQED